MGDIPQSQPNDNDDVSLALDVARARLAAGDHDEAIKWLRKAADAAFDAGDDRRGMELSKAAAELKPGPSAALAPGPPVPGPKPAPLAAGKSAAPPGRAAAPPGGLPKPLHKPVVPSRAAMPAGVRPSPSVPPKAAAQSGRAGPKPQITKPKPEEDESTREFVMADHQQANVPELSSGALVEDSPTHGPHGDEWPTESGHIEQVGDFTDRMRRDEMLKEVDLPVCPALRVAVWRTAEGTVMLRPLDTAGLNDGEHDMMLVALVPDTDVRELFK